MTPRVLHALLQRTQPVVVLVTDLARGTLAGEGVHQERVWNFLPVSLVRTRPPDCTIQTPAFPPLFATPLVVLVLRCRWCCGAGGAGGAMVQVVLWPCCWWWLVLAGGWNYSWGWLALVAGAGDV